MLPKPISNRLLLAIAAVIGLVAVYLFQNINYSALLGFKFGNEGRFIFNRSVRFIMNDCLAILLIYSIFNERKYVIFAIWIQVAGVFLFLIPYFIFRFNSDLNGPVISFLHRFVVNPTLVLLLIPAFYYQKWIANK